MNGYVDRSAYPWAASYPSGVDWSAPISDQPLTVAFDAAVDTYNTNSCIEFLGKSFTYGQVGELADRAAKGLQDLGVGKGVQVGLLLPNSP